jgi:hypothetical protein
MPLLPYNDMVDIAKLVMVGIKLFPILKSGGVPVDPDTEEKEIDNVIDVEGEIVSSKIK